MTPSSPTRRSSDLRGRLLSAAQGTRRAHQRIGGCRRVIGDRMRQDRGVRLGMRHVETAAERVAQLMMQGDRRRNQYHACEPGSAKRLRPRAAVATSVREQGAAGGKRSYRTEENTSELQTLRRIEYDDDCRKKIRAS